MPACDFSSRGCRPIRRCSSTAPGLAGSSATLLLRENVNDASYTDAVAEFPNRFDVVVVDGRSRVACALSATPRLSGSGVIIWDDADRPLDRDPLSPGQLPGDLRALPTNTGTGRS